MKFKNIFLITFLLLAVFSISAVSAEEIDDSAADVLEDINVDDNVLIESSLDTNIIADDDSGSNDTKSSIESSDLTKYYKNESQYIATFYDTNGTPLNGTVVTLKINNGEYHRTTNASGTVKFNVNLPSGNYTMSATNPVTGESVLNNIEVLSTISSENFEKMYGNSSQYCVTIFDGQGNPSSDTLVTFNINGKFYARKTKENGTAYLPINLPSGTYKITVNNTKNDELASYDINVNSTISGEDITKYYKNGTQYYATFLDTQGNPLADTVVSFNINGKMYNRRTNENGTAKFDINLPEGDYTLTATNPNTAEKHSNTVKVLNQIQAGSDMRIEFNSKSNYTVTVYDKNGSTATGKDIKFNINGRFYTRKTNENGTASLPINLPPGNYTITSYYEDSVKSTNIKIRVSPQVEILTTTVKSGDYLKFRLTEQSTGKPIVGTQINDNPIEYDHYGVVYYNESGYGAPPDSNGIVSILLNVPADSYTFMMGINDDGYYSEIYTMNTIVVTN